MKSKIRYFKFFQKSGIAPFTGFDYRDYLPTDGKPGPWLPKVSRISLCKRGYHACKVGNVIDWYDAELYEVELRGRIYGINGNKVVAQQIRLLRRIKGYSESRLDKFENEVYDAEDNTKEEEVLHKIKKYILNLADKSK